MDEVEIKKDGKVEGKLKEWKSDVERNKEGVWRDGLVQGEIEWLEEGRIGKAINRVVVINGRIGGERNGWGEK
jgi:hypothetical protein